MTPVEEAAQQGYSQDEVNAYLTEKSQAAKAAGYSDAEISSYVKQNVTQQPDFNQTPVKVQGQANMAKEAKSPTTLLDAIQTGWGWSNIALAREMLKGTEGQLPEMQEKENNTWYLRGAANLTTTALDIPSMIAGGAIGGGPASPITAMGGAFALPMGLRKVFIDAIQSGEVGTRKDFADRVTGTMWEAAKGWMTGAATAGVGKAASISTSALPGAAKAILPTAAELATLTEVSARLEGHAPEPQALIDNAIVLGVAKAVLPSWAVAPKPNVLTDIYVKTGIPPQHVTGDAIKGNAGVWQDVLDGRVPDAYKQGIEEPQTGPTQAQRTEGLKPAHSVDATKDNAMSSQEKYLYHGSSDAGAKAIEETGILGTIENINLTPSRSYAEAWAKKKGGKVFAIKRTDIPPEMLVTESGHEMQEPAIISGSNLKIPYTVLPFEQKPFPVAPLTREQQAQAKAFMDQPFAEIPQIPNEPSRPTHMNYNRISTTDEAKGALSQLSTLYEDKIKDRQMSPQSWEKSHQAAAQALADVLASDPKTVMKFVEGDRNGPSITAQLLARKELSVGFTEDLMRSRAALLSKGDAATPEELATFLSQVERVSNVASSFLGQRTDVARALNALKSSKREADRSQAIIDAVNSYGGPENVNKLVKMLGEYDNPAQAMKFAKDATKATTWEQVVEAWKAGLVSGLRTHEVNFLSTAAFTTLRLPTEAIASAFGAIRGGDDRVQMAEIPARLVGMAKGTYDGMKVAGAILRTGENIYGPKTEQYAPKIPGIVGDVVRIPFRALSAEDAVLKTVNERAELYALATRQAIQEGKSMTDRGFFDRVSELAATPTPEMTEQAQTAALRYTFNKPLGQGGKAFQRMVHEWHLEWMFPFITTPGNIFKETARMTPGLNFAVKDWREDYAAGGVRRDKALAEVMTGAMIMATVMAAASEGIITGNGTPDKRMRATDRAAGWKPYAVKMNGQYVDGYLRMAPIGPLIGLTVDAHEFWNYMTEGERDEWARMLAFAFANNVSNQTFMTGATNFVNVLQDPSRYGQNYFESLASSVVPAIVGQTAADMDPLLREIHGLRDAMIARVPSMREGLMPKRDLFGQAIPSPERLWVGSPFTVAPISTDKVRTEASRLGFATPDLPKSLDVIPGKAFGKLDKVALTPEQRDVFSSESGQFAYQELAKIVNSPGWDQQPAMIQRQIYEKMFKVSRDMVQKKLLMGVEETVRQEAIGKIEKELKGQKP